MPRLWRRPPVFEILSARPVRVGGLAATRYRLRRPHPYTGHAETDLALSTSDALVVPPTDRREGAPAVTLLNGITKPLQHSVPVAVALAKAGLGAVLLDTPLGGVRKPGGGGSPGAAMAALARDGVVMDGPLAGRMLDGVAGDLAALFALAEAEHGLGRRRRALFGVSFGCLLSSFAFGRDALGDRLLGAIGHPDLPAMARGLIGTFALATGVPAGAVSGGLRLGPLAEAAARRFGGDAAVGGLRFARMLEGLGRGGKSTQAFNPLRWAAGDERPVAFLAGERDPVAPPEAVREAAAAYPASSVEVVPALGHGWYRGGRPPGAPTFEAACAAFALRHLADWTA